MTTITGAMIDQAEATITGIDHAGAARQGTATTPGDFREVRRYLSAAGRAHRRLWRRIRSYEARLDTPAPLG